MRIESTFYTGAEPENPQNTASDTAGVRLQLLIRKGKC